MDQSALAKSKIRFLQEQVKEGGKSAPRESFRHVPDQVRGALAALPTARCASIRAYGVEAQRLAVVLVVFRPSNA